jgi:hypothetical protein
MEIATRRLPATAVYSQCIRHLDPWTQRRARGMRDKSEVRRVPSHKAPDLPLCHKRSDGDELPALLEAK